MKREVFSKRKAKAKYLYLIVCFSLSLTFFLAPEGSASLYKFDFGPDDQKVLDDFVPVSEKTIYSEDRGYGWVPTTDPEPRNPIPGLSVRDRIDKSGKGRICDSLYRDFCTSEGYYHPQVEQEFVVDLPEGKYRVLAFSGDIAYGAAGEERFWIEAEGQRKLDKFEYGADLCGRAEFEVDVKDGKLNLRLGDDAEDVKEKRWRLNGLIISPFNNSEEQSLFKREVSEVDKTIIKERKALFASLQGKVEPPKPIYEMLWDEDEAINYTPPDDFKKIVYEEKNTLPTLTANEKSRGYLLFVRDWMRKIHPNTIPLRKEIDNKDLSLFASIGEYEPATFGIYPMKDLDSVKIQISDLVSKNGKIGSQNVEIRITRYANERFTEEVRTAGDYSYYIKGSSWSKTYMVIPKILDKYGSRSLKKGETKQIWLTFKVPDDAKSGDYEGTVSFKPDNAPEEILNIKLAVLPIKLEKNPRIEGMYWRVEPVYPQNRKKQLVDMAEHGVRGLAFSLTSSLMPYLKEEDNGELGLDFSRLDVLMDEIKEAGLTGYIPLYGLQSIVSHLSTQFALFPSYNMGYDDIYKFFVKETLKHAEEKGWPPILFYPVDEIGNDKERQETFKREGALIREVPGAKVYCTVNDFDAGVECQEHIDYWCTNIPFTREQEDYVLDKGKIYMRYGDSYNYDPRRTRTASGFGFWKKPAVSMYYWHYQAIVGNAYNALDGGSRDWLTAFPSPDGPIPTVDWESIREGIDDLNYIHTLQTLMEKARGAGKEKLTEEGEKILEEIRSCDPSYDQYDLRGVPNEKYNEFRFRMASEIIKLQDALK